MQYSGNPRILLIKTNFDNHEESDLQPEGTGRHRPL